MRELIYPILSRKIKTSSSSIRAMFSLSSGLSSNCILYFFLQKNEVDVEENASISFIKKQIFHIYISAQFLLKNKRFSLRYLSPATNN